MTHNDQLLFADDAPETARRRPAGETGGAPWKVVVVDDEAEVHSVTKLVLSSFKYRGRGLAFVSAFSGEQARSVIAANPDAAVILLDVVMEENDTGLALVKYIRETVGNPFVRIILRTGQPGHAPEGRIIVEYDINDYKEKTELTAQKLSTTILAALRTYCDILTIEANRDGLEHVIEASKAIFERKSLEKFSGSVLKQLQILTCLHERAAAPSGFAAFAPNGGGMGVLAARGVYEQYLGGILERDLPGEVVDFALRAARSEKMHHIEGNRFAGLVRSKTGLKKLFYFEGCSVLSELDRKLVGIFFNNVGIAFDNICLNREIEDTQREIIFTLGETIECRSKETGNHVRRVSEYLRLLARKYGLPEEEADMLRVAAPLHDVGKLAIPDAILNKPGRLTEAEFEEVKKHSGLGFELLKPSRRAILQTAAIIANQHHERYDGTGYPNRLAGEAIHVYGRLGAVVDVFDALASDRVYRKAWDMERIVQYMRKQRGRQFDPEMLDLLLANLDEFLAIRDRFSDTPCNGE
ncbi:MAG: DUF3369 domain-containing protein [Desulfovibrionaceae bacterium]|nr:DUF3369 domain-containing protein [Desulfovibrionaceae bacterium]